MGHSPGVSPICVYSLRSIVEIQAKMTPGTTPALSTEIAFHFLELLFGDFTLGVAALEDVEGRFARKHAASWLPCAAC